MNPFWWAYFSNGLVQPPTSKSLSLRGTKCCPNFLMFSAWNGWPENEITQPTWRTIPFSKWLVTPIYKPFSPFGMGITLLSGLTIHGYYQILTGMSLQVGHPETEGYVMCSTWRHYGRGERLHHIFFSRQKFPRFYEFINLPGKQPLLLISINFTPKIHPQLPKKMVRIPMFSRYFCLVRVSTTPKMAWKLGSITGEWWSRRFFFWPEFWLVDRSGFCDRWISILLMVQKSNETVEVGMFPRIFSEFWNKPILKRD